jgi:hypothetical protein
MFQVSDEPKLTLGKLDEPMIICPACGKQNSAEAVFCVNAQCHKALGEFKYVGEELRAEIRWHEALAERVSSFIGNPSLNSTMK